MSSLPPGTRVGPYEVLSAIGAGGMGQVFRAHDTSLHREVALKILPPGFVGDAEYRARFSREARALATLNHPHIAQVYGLEDSAAGPVIVMELVPGTTLRDRIAQWRRAHGGAAVGAADRGGARCRPRQGHHSSRSEARQHHGDAGRKRARSWISASRRRRSSTKARPLEKRRSPEPSKAPWWARRPI